MKIKRLLSWLLMCAMLLSMLPGMAITGAAEPSTLPPYTASSLAELGEIKDKTGKEKVNVSNNGKTVAAVIWKGADENKDLFYLAVATAGQQKTIKEFNNAGWTVSTQDAVLTVTPEEGTSFSNAAQAVSPSPSNQTKYWCVKAFTKAELGTPTLWEDNKEYYKLTLPTIPGGFKLGALIVPKKFVDDEIIGNAITDFDKELVNSQPNDVNISSDVTITYPDSTGMVTIPADGSVTLLYKLEVTGKAGADFTITDQNAKLVGSSNCNITSGNSSPFTGTITDTGDDATAILYVIKTFKADDIQNNEVSNTATITSTGGVADGKGTATAKTPAEKEGTPKPSTPREPNENELNTVEVKVSCTNPVAGHTSQTYYLTNTECSSKIISEVSGTYQCVVTLNCQAFAGKYKEGGYHTLHPENQSKYVTFIWNESDQTWSVPQNTSIDISVKCEYPPEPQYAITGFDKELVKSEAAIPNYVTVSDISYPADGKVIIPANGTVTLLYKLTVTGKNQASFTILDDRASVVGSDNCVIDETETDTGKIVGKIDVTSDQGTATIYVTKTFTARDITDDHVINTASIEAKNDGTVAPGIADPEVKTPAEEGKPNAPDEDTLKELLAGKISVSCITASTAHPSETFGWMENGCIPPTAGVTGNATDGWEYVITIDHSFYVNHYNDIKLQLPAGTHSPNKDTKPTITLKWTGNGWLCKEIVALEAVCSLYTLTYDANGGKFDNGAESFQVTGIPNGTDYTLKEETNYVDPTRPGAVFCGWTTEEEAIDKVYGLNEELPRIVIRMSINKNRTVYAIWQEEEPTTEWVSITFNSGKHGDFGWYYHNSKHVEIIKDSRLSANDIPTVYPDSGYKFVGWYKDGNKSKLYSDADLLEMKFKTNATFTALYKEKGGSGVDVDDDYDVIYNANFTDGGYPRRVGYDEDDKVTVSDNKWFEREGYTFIGWNTKANGNGDSYLPGDTFRMPDSDVYLYAQWQKEKPGPDDTGVSRWLETEDHNAYLTGYPDSTFGADRNMTRAEVAQMFYSLLKNKNVMITTSFSDVSNDAWYATAVKTMASLGMMSGYPDGTFRPDEPITRAEFATVALAFAYEPDNARCSYLDVSTSAWYYTYVAQATTYGWIGGYPDGTFRPNNSITRVEVCVIVNNMLGRTPDEDYIDRNEDELVNFVDLSDRYWGYYTIMEATNGHEYTGNYSNETWKDVV